MNRKMLKQLHSERIRRIESAFCKLLANDHDGAKTDMEWAEMCSQIAANNPDKHILSPTTIVIFLCIFAAVLVLTIPCGSIYVSGEVESTSVSMTLADSYDIEFVSDDILITNLDYLPQNKWTDPGKIDAQGKTKEAVLKQPDSKVRMKLPRYSKLDISLQGNTLKLSVSGEPMKGEFLVRQSAMAPPEIINFKTAKAINDPVMLELVLKGNWQASLWQIREMDFLEEVSLRLGRFESTVVSGKVRLPQIRYTEDLRKGDTLILKTPLSKDGKQENITFRKIDISKDVIKVFFDGSVSKISAGLRNFERNLMPSLLEKFYYQDKLKIIWLSAAFLFTLVWKIRSAIIG